MVLHTLEWEYMNWKCFPHIYEQLGLGSLIHCLQQLWITLTGNMFLTVTQVILGVLVCIMISARLNDGTEINIRPTVIAGSSQWLIGRNVTTKCDIIHTNRNYLKLSNQKVVPLQKVDMHSYIPSYIFLNKTNNNSSYFLAKLFWTTGSIGESTNLHPWFELKRIIDKVHKHVCGHASLSDIQILLQRNNMWTSEVKKYLRRVLNSAAIVLTLLNSNKPERFP